MYCGVNVLSIPAFVVLTVFQFYIFNIVGWWGIIIRVGSLCASLSLLNRVIYRVNNIRLEHVVVIIHDGNEVVGFCTVIRDKSDIL